MFIYLDKEIPFSSVELGFRENYMCTLPKESPWVFEIFIRSFWLSDKIIINSFSRGWVSQIPVLL